MQGILIVDKPTDWTSFDVIAKLRGILGTRKLGHSGTLDPMATGVLPVFCGGASKAVDLQLDHTKAYRAVLRLGARTDTGDSTGTVLETAPVTAGERELQAVLPQFVGKQMQVPPMYSAIKLNGQPLYKLAREGVTVERKARPIEIYSITYGGSPAENEYVLDVTCSKGTYIRTLCNDIGEKLGCGACMEYLVRTRVSDFQIEDAKTLQEIETIMKSGKIEEILYPIDTVFKNLPQIHSRKDSTALLYNGNKLPLPVIAEAETIEHTLASFYKEDRVYDNANHFVGIYEYRTADRLFKPVKLFFTQQ